MIVGEPPGLTSAMLLPATSVVTRSAKVDGFFAPDAGGSGLETGRAGSVEQTLQETIGGVGEHARDVVAGRHGEGSGPCRLSI